jgi:DnaJ domain
MTSQSFPLQWPTGWPRTASHLRKAGPFKMPPGKVRYELNRELAMLGARGVVISSNVMTRADGLPYAKQPRTEDSGVVLYFTLDGNEVSIPCDRWSSIDSNLRAIGMAVEAIRGMERWGTGQMVKAAFRGFTALPASASSGTSIVPQQPWYDVLGVSPEAPMEVVDAAYKAMQRKTHPDIGGSNDAFLRVQKAYEEATK